MKEYTDTRNRKVEDTDFNKLGRAGGFNKDLLDYNAKLYTNIEGENLIYGGYSKGQQTSSPEDDPLYRKVTYARRKTFKAG